MYCHQDNKINSIFKCKSTFTPKVVISLNDTIPESVKQERQKGGEIEYLPGEKLLISLAKQQKKKPAQEKVDVERLTKSLRRVINFS
jgi:hypothetical protein